MAGMTGDDIYRNFHEAPGSGSLHRSADGLREVAGQYDVNVDHLIALVAQMEGCWTGEAAGAAHRAAGPLSVRHEAGVPVVEGLRGVATQQAGAFEAAKRAVVEVPPLPAFSLNPLDHIWPADGKPYFQKVVDHVVANNTNVQVMRNYEANTAHTSATIPAALGQLSGDGTPLSLREPTVQNTGIVVSDPAAPGSTGHAGAPPAHPTTRTSTHVAPPPGAAPAVTADPAPAPVSAGTTTPATTAPSPVHTGPGLDQQPLPPRPPAPVSQVGPGPLPGVAGTGVGPAGGRGAAGSGDAAGP
ncbi:hypothetical protein L6E12_05755, partial [Actinokineospora sp. PR83]|nr:hypothetical protein [Actinokineospora sp. PR83]